MLRKLKVPAFQEDMGNLQLLWRHMLDIIGLSSVALCTAWLTSYKGAIHGVFSEGKLFFRSKNNRITVENRWRKANKSEQLSWLKKYRHVCHGHKKQIKGDICFYLAASPNFQYVRIDLSRVMTTHLSVQRPISKLMLKILSALILFSKTFHVRGVWYCQSVFWGCVGLRLSIFPQISVKSLDPLTFL